MRNPLLQMDLNGLHPSQWGLPNLTDVFEENPTGGDQLISILPSGKLVDTKLNDKVLKNKRTHSWMEYSDKIDGMQPLDYNTPKACKS